MVDKTDSNICYILLETEIMFAPDGHWFDRYTQNEYGTILFPRKTKHILNKYNLLI